MQWHYCRPTQWILFLNHIGIITTPEHAAATFRLYSKSIQRDPVNQKIIIVIQRLKKQHWIHNKTLLLLLFYSLCKLYKCKFIIKIQLRLLMGINFIYCLDFFFKKFFILFLSSINIICMCVHLRVLVIVHSRGGTF